MGASFSIVTGGVLILFVAAPPNGSSVWMRVVDEVSGAMFEPEIAADVPANTRGLSPRLFMNNAATAAAVEDEMIISMDLQMLLEELQIEVVGTAISADEADAVVAAERPDVVTVDITIKGDRDGLTAANEIFEKYDIRSIFVSAYGDAATMVRAESAKPFGWVRKPPETLSPYDLTQFRTRNRFPLSLELL